MRNTYNGLSFMKAFTGIILFVGIDLISLVLFESPLVMATLIAYSCTLTATHSRFAYFFAALAVFLVAFLKDSFSWHLVASVLVLWVCLFFAKRVLRYNFFVRFVISVLFLFACEPIKSWSVAKIVLNGLWLVFGLTFFV